jgi:hypothetical protein
MNLMAAGHFFVPFFKLISGALCFWQASKISARRQ